VEATGLNDQSTRRSRPTEDGQLLRVSSSGAWKEEEDDSHMAGRFISFALNYNAAFSWVHRVGEMLAILSCSLLSAGSAGCIARYISEVGAFCLRSWAALKPHRSRARISPFFYLLCDPLLTVRLGVNPFVIGEAWTSSPLKEDKPLLWKHFNVRQILLSFECSKNRSATWRLLGCCCAVLLEKTHIMEYT
jgi:hypothetical protein